ncbi:hypothetical protein [Hymenobacter weizhouensis]|uniref:hypothetical protein n=1 Tax=Hymenobacter sp. YIM 151500-1 TaxID=2987689 RepID=UPI002226F5BC|nr:hypothetical protein [Hymenobacter sp. YIM 151500-1]UYZ61476.1 hypothetical protein OIS53_10695 [Hymenobacter sp. YIM 151500-1]
MLSRSLPFVVCWALALPVLAQQTPRELNSLPGTPPATRPAPTTPAPAAPAPAAPATTAVAPAADTSRQTAPRTLASPPALPDSAVQAARQAPPVPANTTRYAVGLKTGQVVRGYDVEIRQPVFGRSFLLVDGQQRFELDQVRYYEDESGFYVRTTLPGRTKRESTLRRDRVGRISLYSITSQQYVNNPGGFGPYGRFGGPYGGFGGPWGGGWGGYRTVRQEYFSKDNGPIEDLSIRNLQRATTDSPGSQKLLADARRYQTATTLSYIGAGGLFLAGMLSSFGGNNGFSVSPLVYGAIPLAIVPLVIGGKQQNNIRQAILLYNRGQ